MASASEWVREVGEVDFDAEVLERSHEVPVLVDFWAPWCGPCRMLGPVLEQLAEEFGGKFVLAKVDTEAHPRLGQRFAVRSIPAVKLFSKGKVVDEFVGAQPGGAIRKFLERHLPDPLSDRVAAALAELDRDPAAARTALEAVLGEAPDHVGAHLGLARVALRTGDLAAVHEHVDAIDPGDDVAELAGRYLELAELAEATPDPEGEHDAKLVEGLSLAASEQYPAALETLLDAVRESPRHRDRAAQRAMVAIFGILPRDDEARDAYQRQLQIYT